MPQLPNFGPGAFRDVPCAHRKPSGCSREEPDYGLRSVADLFEGAALGIKPPYFSFGATALYVRKAVCQHKTPKRFGNVSLRNHATTSFNTVSSPAKFIRAR
jgi:hypothetical protein